MKKLIYSLLFLSVLLGLSYIFGLYANHIAKLKIDQLIVSTNDFIETHPNLFKNNKINITSVQTDSSLFSSTQRISVIYKDETNDTQQKTVNIDVLVEYGFFPLSNLKGFNFSPVLAKLTADLPATIFDRELLIREQNNKNAPLANIVLSVDLSKVFTLDANIFPFTYNTPNLPIQFGGANFNMLLSADNVINNLNISANKTDIRLNSPWIPSGHIIDEVVKTLNNNPRHNFKFDSFSMKYVTNPNNSNFYLGEKMIDIKNFSFNILEYPILSSGEFKFKQGEIQRDNITEIESIINLDTLKIYGLDIGTGEATFTSLHRSLNDVKIFYEKVFNIFKENQLKRTDINPTPSIETFLTSLENIFATLQLNPGYRIMPFKWKNKAGNLSITNEVIFTNSLSYEQNVDVSPYKNVNVFYIDLIADSGVIPMFMTHIDQINGIEKSVALEKNQKLVDSNINLLISSGLLLPDNNRLRFTFSYMNNTYTLNGISYTKNQILEFISLISLRQNGLLSSDNLIKLNNYLSNTRGTQ